MLPLKERECFFYEAKKQNKMIVIVKQKQENGEQLVNNFAEMLHESNATLIDGSMLPQMAKIDIDNADMSTLKNNLGQGWEMFAEKKYTVPDTRRKIGNKSAD